MLDIYLDLSNLLTAPSVIVSAIVISTCLFVETKANFIDLLLVVGGRKHMQRFCSKIEQKDYGSW